MRRCSPAPQFETFICKLQSTVPTFILYEYMQPLASLVIRHSIKTLKPKICYCAFNIIVQLMRRDHYYFTILHDRCSKRLLTNSYHLPKKYQVHGLLRHIIEFN